MTMLEEAREAAQELGITEQQALALAFCTRAALASVAGNRKAEIIFQLGANHAAGLIDHDTMTRSIEMVDPDWSKRT